LKVVDRSQTDKYIILACDGIWDCLSNEEACTKVNELNQSIRPDKMSHHKIVEKIFDDIIAPNTDDGIGTDNMSCILIYFNS
jgi:protein phosphatase 1G